MLKIGLVSLGCSKNLVDTEMVIGIVKKAGYELENNPEKADVIIINTCGFIEEAKQEAINTILEMAKYKENKCKYLIVMGCLVKRYKEELIKELPEVDLFISPDEYDKIQMLLKGLLTDVQDTYCMEYNDRVLTTPSYLAYLKIAEGCNNHCTYCAIPLIRGPMVSRKFEDILFEANLLYSKGIKEIVVIAQDTSKYGTDIYGKTRLPELLQEIAHVGFKWVRVLYTYPESISDELINVMKENDIICSYFDIPIQHISDTVLRRMGRKGDSKLIKEIINKIRKEINGVIVRTTLIVGFPGETQEDFDKLYDFVKETKFDRLGVFKYSKEDGTPAEKLDGHLEENIKEERYDKIMKLQQQISYDNNKKKIGNVYEMLVTSIDAHMVYGRTYMDVTDIDGYIACKKKDNDVKVGDFVNIKIVDCNEYDLKGEII